jgi:hypothetical protein
VNDDGPREAVRRDGTLRRWWGAVRRHWRWLLFAAGLTAVGFLIRDVGPERVAAVLWRARWLVAPIAILEVAWVSMDVLALRILFGADRASRVPLSAWLRSGMVAYGWMILLPAGRAGGEIARAAELAPHVGGTRAAAGAAHLQSVTMMANSLISVPCYLAAAARVGPFEPLSLLIAGNGLVTAFIGGIVMFGARNSRIGAWLGARFNWLARHGDSLDDALRQHHGFPLVPVLLTTGGRVLQTVQYGLVLVAVGATLTLPNALVAEGIHLVAAGVGDMVPNQAGVSEGTYRLFAGALGLGEEPARALSIALVIRAVQFSLGAVALGVGAVWSRRTDGRASGRGRLSEATKE